MSRRGVAHRPQAVEQDRRRGAVAVHAAGQDQLQRRIGLQAHAVARLALSDGGLELEAQAPDAAHARGQLVAGYGVSVGTTTLLPQFGLENKIDFLVDDDPKKGNVMAGPGYDIPILSPAALYERKPAFVVVFAWRYVDPIRAKHARYFAEGGKFVVPLPGISVVDRAD